MNASVKKNVWAKLNVFNNAIMIITKNPIIQNVLKQIKLGAANINEHRIMENNSIC